MILKRFSSSLAHNTRRIFAILSNPFERIDVSSEILLVKVEHKEKENSICYRNNFNFFTHFQRASLKLTVFPLLFVSC